MHSVGPRGLTGYLRRLTNRVFGASLEPGHLRPATERVLIVPGSDDAQFINTLLLAHRLLQVVRTPAGLETYIRSPHVGAVLQPTHTEQSSV